MPERAEWGRRRVRLYLYTRRAPPARSSLTALRSARAQEDNSWRLSRSAGSVPPRHRPASTRPRSFPRGPSTDLGKRLLPPPQNEPRTHFILFPPKPRPVEVTAGRGGFF